MKMKMRLQWKKQLKIMSQMLLEGFFSANCIMCIAVSSFKCYYSMYFISWFHISVNYILMPTVNNNMVILHSISLNIKTLEMTHFSYL